MGLASVNHGLVQFNSWAYSHYAKNKTLRYSSYALGVLGIIGAHHRYGHFKIGLMLSVVTLIILNELRKKKSETFANPLSAEAKLSTLSRIAPTIFIISLLWGLAFTANALSGATQHGKNILQGACQKNLFEGIKSMFELTGSIGYTIPVGVFLIQKGDDFFYSTLGDTLKSKFRQFLNNKPKEQTNNFVISFLNFLRNKNSLDINLELIFGKKHTKDFRLRVEGLMAFFEPYKIPLVDFKKTSLFFSYASDVLWNTKIVPSSFLVGTRKIANSLFNHSLNFSLLAAKIYFNPLPITAGFLCGLMCPTEFRFKKELKHSWQHAPFIDLPLRNKCAYLTFRLFKVIIPLYLGYPMALIEGLYLAEDFRYYALPRLNRWIILPIKPSYILIKENPWQIFLKEDFQKIRTQTNPLDDPAYQEFHRKVLQGASARKLLNLDKDVIDESRNEAYKKHCLKIHPDHNLGKTEEAGVLFKCLNQANEGLKEKNRAPQQDIHPPSHAPAREGAQENESSAEELD